MIVAAVIVVCVLLGLFYISSSKNNKRLPPPKILQDERWGTHNYATLQDSGIKMHYVESGDRSKPLMLFLHGFPEFWYSWRHSLVYFSQYYWCVAPDLRGYGDTEKPKGVKNYAFNLLVNDIKDLIVALGKSQCILVAHDWGGVIGYSLCYKYPDLVQTYIAVNTIHPESWIREIKRNKKQLFASWYMFYFQIPYLPEMRLAKGYEKLFKRIFGKFSSTEDLEAYHYTFQDMEAWNCSINYYRSKVRAAAMKMLKSVFSGSGKSKGGGKIITPVLCLYGNKDHALTGETITGAKDFCEQFEVESMDGVGHFSNSEAPDLVNTNIKAYLQKMGM